MKKFAVVLTALVLVFGLSACSKGKIFDQTEYEVEYGSTFNLPKADGDYTVTVTDGTGKEVRTQFGSFRPAVGEYRAAYQAGGKKQTLTIKCADTTAPDIRMSPVSGNAVVGDVLTFPEFSASDLSGVATTDISVTRSNGSAVELDGQKRWTAENETYTLTVKAVDVYGNTASRSFTVKARVPYADEHLKNGLLMDFDDDAYLNLVYGADGNGETDFSIVRDGYPTIEDEEEGNACLKISSDVNYGDVSATFAYYGDFTVSRADKLSLRICPDRDTDYIKIVDYEGNVLSAAYMLEGGKWVDLQLDPMDYGYGKALGEFTLITRADKGLNLYIDDLHYGERFLPALHTGELAVFNDERYTGRMYQNIYNKASAKCVAGGSVFEVVDLDATKAMRVTTTVNRGGFTYMFNEALDLANVASVTVRMNVQKSPSNLWVGTMQGSYRDGGSYREMAEWLQNGDWGKLTVGEMRDYVIPAEFLKRCCVDGYMTGIWLSVIDGSHNGNVIDIESITVQYNEQ